MIEDSKYSSDYNKANKRNSVTITSPSATKTKIVTEPVGGLRNDSSPKSHSLPEMPKETFRSGTVKATTAFYAVFTNPATWAGIGGTYFIAPSAPIATYFLASSVILTALRSTLLAFKNAESVLDKENRTQIKTNWMDNPSFPLIVKTGHYIYAVKESFTNKDLVKTACLIGIIVGLIAEVKIIAKQHLKDQEQKSKLALKEKKALNSLLKKVKLIIPYKLRKALRDPGFSFVIADIVYISANLEYQELSKSYLTLTSALIGMTILGLALKRIVSNLVKKDENENKAEEEKSDPKNCYAFGFGSFFNGIALIASGRISEGIGYMFFLPEGILLGLTYSDKRPSLKDIAKIVDNLFRTKEEKS